MHFYLLYHKTITFFHAFVIIMLHRIDVDEALQYRPKETIDVLLELKKKLDTFEQEISEAFEKLVVIHQVRDDFYKNPLPSLGLYPIYFIVKNTDSIQYRIMEVFHKADQLIVAYSEVLENFDLIGIPGAVDWSDEEINDYYYDFMGERDRWVERTRVVLNKLKKLSKPLMVTDDVSDVPNVAPIDSDIALQRIAIDKLHEEMAKKSRNNLDIGQDIVEIIRLQQELFLCTKGKW